MVVEAFPVQHLRGVVAGRHGAWRLDLVPVAVGLGPEGRSPRAVQRLAGLVAFPQPLTEGGGRFLVETLSDVAPVFVGDVPHDDGRVGGKARGHAVDQGERRLAKNVRGRAVLLARPEPQVHAVRVDGEGVRVGGGHPRGERGGARCQVDADSRVVQAVEECAQPVEFVVAFAGFEFRPGEDTQGDQGNSGFAHEVDVCGDGGVVPLFGVPVATVCGGGEGKMGCRHGGVSSGSRGGRGRFLGNEVPLVRSVHHRS